MKAGTHIHTQIMMMIIITTITTSWEKQREDKGLTVLRDGELRYYLENLPWTLLGQQKLEGIQKALICEYKRTVRSYRVTGMDQILGPLNA